MAGVWVVFNYTTHYGGNIIHSIHKTEEEAIETKKTYILKCFENGYDLTDDTINVYYYEFGEWCLNPDLENK